MIEYHGFCELSLNKQITSLVMIDDYANNWDCILIFGYLPNENFKIRGQWKCIIVARRIHEGAEVMDGAPMAGTNEALYFNSLFRFISFSLQLRLMLVFRNVFK
jgi:hypothetical protein